jgi:hypothetical protein
MHGSDPVRPARHFAASSRRAPLGGSFRDGLGQRLMTALARADASGDETEPQLRSVSRPTHTPHGLRGAGGVCRAG